MSKVLVMVHLHQLHYYPWPSITACQLLLQDELDADNLYLISLYCLSSDSAVSIDFAGKAHFACNSSFDMPF